jgi:hypothetical protein
MPFGLGTGDAHLGRIVPMNGIHAGTTSITFHARILERVSEGHQALLPRDNDALSTIKLLPPGKELLLQFDGHYQRGNRGPTPVNKQRPMSR